MGEPRGLSQRTLFDCAPLLLRKLDALAHRRAVALTLFALIALAFTSPLYRRAMHLGHGDWLWFHFTWDTARKTLVEYHELPWWNPYYCGGNLGVANPQAFSLSPLFLLLLPLQTAVAMKAYLTTLTFAGLWGTYELCRARYGAGLWAVVAAVFFACSGYMGWHMNGQTGMANLHLLPWAVHFFLLGVRRPVISLGTGLVLAFMLCTSGLYPCVITSVALAMVGLVVLFERQWGETLRVLRSGAIAALSTVPYAAIKLVPLVDFLRDHRRPIPMDDAIGLPLLVDALLVRRTTETQIWDRGDGYLYAWWGEYSNYVGVAGVLIAAVGLWCARPRFGRELWLVLLALSLVIGDHGSYSPYAILRSLPMLGNLRVPTRYWVVVDVWVACLIAHAGWWLTRQVGVRLRGKLRAMASAAMLLVALLFVVDVVRSNGVAIFAGAMPTAPALPHVEGLPFRQVTGSSSAMYRYPPRNQGTLRCFDELSVEISPALRPELPSEAYLLEPDAGAVSMLRWTPNSWLLSVDAARPTKVIVNQNDYRGWRAEGGVYAPYEGLVAVDVPEGHHEVRVWYRPRFYQLGVAVTFVSLLATGALLWRARRRALCARAAAGDHRAEGREQRGAAYADGRVDAPDHQRLVGAVLWQEALKELP